VATDRDAEILEEARGVLAPFGARARLVHANHREIPAVLGEEKADGILLDLGVSSAQLDTAERGFSFSQDGPLDMRMDRSQGETAADVVNRMREDDLADLIYAYGEERASRRIAKAIVAARRQQRLTTTSELAAIVRRNAGRQRRPRADRGPGIDPATRTFQALRIHVNRELEGMGASLAELAQCLAPSGRLVVIAFHSLEDREVKLAFRALDRRGFSILTKKPLRPSAGETARNPRSRSARLRGLRRDEEAA
jgi:16S rRNA (cytosine1402-N4)-methyltransferase